MKNILIITLLIIPFFCFAQTSGVVNYTHTIKIDISGRDLPKEILDQIPKERISHKTLIFNENESSYKTLIKEEETDVEGESGGMRFRMRMMGGNEKEQTYKNLEEKIAIDQRDLMGKLFKINADIEDTEWKITGEKKIIFKYMVLEAQTMIDDTVAISAWFTPQIPVSNGPQMFGGLPGLILEVHIGEEGKNVIRPTEIALREIDVSEIVKPDEGKEVTHDEFREIRKEKMQEMREMRGGRKGGNRVIIRG